MPAGPRARSAGGAVAQYHHANKGGDGHVLRRCGGEAGGELGGRTRRKPVWLRSRPIQDGMEAMTPRVGSRLRHPKELALDFLDRMLCQRGQHQEPRVGHRGSGPGLIRPRAAAGAGVPSHGVLVHRGHIRPLDMRQERGDFLFGSPGHGPSTPGALDDLFVAGHQHLRHSGRER